MDFANILSSSWGHLVHVFWTCPHLFDLMPDCHSEACARWTVSDWSCWRSSLWPRWRYYCLCYEYFGHAWLWSLLFLGCVTVHVALRPTTMWVKDFAVRDYWGGLESGLCLISYPSSSPTVASWSTWLENSSFFGYRSLFSSLSDIFGPSKVLYHRQWKNHWLLVHVLQNKPYLEHFDGVPATSQLSPKSFSSFWAFPFSVWRIPSWSTYRRGSWGFLLHQWLSSGRFGVDGFQLFERAHLLLFHHGQRCLRGPYHLLLDFGWGL